MVELLELTQCDNQFFCRIFARSVGDRCRLCDFHVPVQYNHTTQRAFSSSPDFRDFVIYHHSVSRRIEPHWATVANDRRRDSLGTRSVIRTARRNQMKVNHITYRMKPQAPDTVTASFAHLDKSFLVTTPKERSPIALGVYPTGNNIDSSSFEAARFLC